MHIERVTVLRSPFRVALVGWQRAEASAEVLLRLALVAQRQMYQPDAAAGSK
jgi:hypothetical protein